MTYHCLRCSLPRDFEDELATLLDSWPVLGSEVRAGPRDWISVDIFLTGEHRHAADRLSVILAANGARDIRLELVEEQDWLAGYRETVTSFQVGDCWWIDPHPDRPTPSPGGLFRLAIEPRMAFGTGSHESTRLILRSFEGLEVAGSRVLDVGTGSGILALAADRLNARRIVAVDIDPQAIWVARQIAAQQEWKTEVRFVLGPVECLAGLSYDLIVCNMISANLFPLLPEMTRLLAPGGRAVFSGLLTTEAARAVAAIAEVGMRIEKEHALGEWVGFTVLAAGGKAG
ncbi:MAG: 50S ribosomal protein L11 methyltransferase [Thermoanaerobaculales bacterium]